MNSFSMGCGTGFGWIWNGFLLLLVGLTIAALTKYLHK